MNKCYRYFNAYKDNKSSQAVEILDEEENDILNSNDNDDALYSEFDEDNELVQRRVECIALSSYIEECNLIKDNINKAIKDIYRKPNFKKIISINYINQMNNTPYEVNSNGILCIIEYTVCVH